VSGVASGFPSRKAAGYWVNTIRQGLTEGQSGKTTNQRFLSRYGQNHTAAGLWLTQKISRVHQLRQLSGVQLSWARATRHRWLQILQRAAGWGSGSRLPDQQLQAARSLRGRGCHPVWRIQQPV